MIEVKDFENLLQVQSIEVMIAKHHTAILDHQKRVEKIKSAIMAQENQCQESEKSLKILNKQINQDEKDLTELDTKLQRTKNNANEVTSIQQSKAIEKELSHLEDRKNELEEGTISLLEESEELEIQISDANSFCTGAKESLESIQGEVNNDVLREQSEIQSLNKRIENLFSISSTEAQQAYKSSAAKFKDKFPIAHIIDSRCNRCFNGVPRHLESQANRGISVDHCPGCGRLLAPNI